MANLELGFNKLSGFAALKHWILPVIFIRYTISDFIRFNNGIRAKSGGVRCDEQITTTNFPKPTHKQFAPITLFPNHLSNQIGL